MSNIEKYAPPLPDLKDRAFTVVRAGVASIPVIGNAAIEFLSAFATPSLERRRQQWMEDIANGLRILEDNRQINLGDLQSNDIFITTLVQASDVAVKTHQQEKLQALRHAVLNSAIGVSIEEDLQVLFIRYINELMPSHFGLLTYFRDHEQTVEKSESYEKLFTDFVSHNPNTTIQREEFRLLCEDLISRVLLRISPHVEDFDDVGLQDFVVIGRDGDGDKPLLRVTEIGKKLLMFITLKN